MKPRFYSCKCSIRECFMSITGPGQLPTVCPSNMASPADWQEKSMREVEKMVIKRTPGNGDKNEH